MTGDFGNLLAALAVLRANPKVNGASLEVHMDSEADVTQPTPTDPGAGVDGLGTGSMSYSWDDVRNAAKEPIGTGGNWGLEASRFPQAWNLLDSIIETGGAGYGPSGPQTVDLDGGFDLTHPDLKNVTLIDDLCPPDTPGVCNPNPTGARRHPSRHCNRGHHRRGVRRGRHWCFCAPHDRRESRGAARRGSVSRREGDTQPRAPGRVLGVGSAH